MQPIWVDWLLAQQQTIHLDDKKNGLFDKIED